MFWQSHIKDYLVRTHPIQYESNPWCESAEYGLFAIFPSSFDEMFDSRNIQNLRRVEGMLNIPLIWVRIFCGQLVELIRSEIHPSLGASFVSSVFQALGA